jgi:hypothetical protein
MTEAEWLVCRELWKMLYFLEDKASERRLRLFAVACCRLFWHLLTDDRSRRAIEVTERFADGEASEEELGRAWEAAGAVNPSEHGSAARHPAWRAAHTAAWCVAELDVHTRGNWSVFQTVAGDAACVVLRDVFGNFFRPREADPRWLTFTVVSLANSVYTERAFDCLPILADALEEAGCTDAAVLGHLRGPGPHARGCWVIDLLLGKT